MRLRLEITGDGEAFDDAPATELADLVHQVATEIEIGRFGATVLDNQGNACGSWAVSGPLPEEASGGGGA